MITEMMIELDGERFRVVRRPGGGPSDPTVTYDYDWLTGPNEGYGFSLSGPNEYDRDAHLQQLRDFLAGVDPETGFLADS